VGSAARFAFAEENQQRREDEANVAENGETRPMSPSFSELSGDESKSKSVLKAKAMFKKRALNVQQRVIANRMEQAKDAASSTVKHELRTRASCQSLPFTLLLWGAFAATQWSHRQINKAYTIQEVMSEGLITFRPQASDADATTLTSRRLGIRGSNAEVARRGTETIGAVLSLDDVLAWSESVVVDLMWHGETPDRELGPGVFLEFNRIIGGARLQQQRAKAAQCNGLESLLSVYNLTCYSFDELDESPISPPVVNSTEGTVADSYGFYNYWFDVALTKSEAKSHAQQLRSSDWLTPATDLVKVQTAFYSGTIELFIFSEVYFHFHRGGAFFPIVKVRALPARVFKSWTTIFGDMVVILLLFYLFVGESLNLAKAIRTRMLLQYLNVYKAVNWAIIIFGTGFSSFFVYLVFAISGLSDMLGDIPGVPVVNSTAASQDSQGQAHYGVEWNGRHDSMNKAYDELQRLVSMLTWAELGTFWYLLVIMLKLFEAFEASPRLAVMTITLRRATSDIIHFFVVFGSIYITFAFGAYFLVGHQLYQWSTLGLAMNSSFRTLMGDFDFLEMVDIAPFSVTVWFWLYMVLMYLILLNMFLAIIMDAYAQVKRDTEKKATLWQQLNRTLIHTLAKGARVAKGSGKKGDTAPTGAIADGRRPSADSEPEEASSPKSRWSLVGKRTGSTLKSDKSGFFGKIVEQLAAAEAEAEAANDETKVVPMKDDEKKDVSSRPITPAASSEDFKQLMAMVKGISNRLEVLEKVLHSQQGDRESSQAKDKDRESPDSKSENVELPNKIVEYKPGRGMSASRAAQAKTYTRQPADTSPARPRSSEPVRIPTVEISDGSPAPQLQVEAWATQPPPMMSWGSASPKKT